MAIFNRIISFIALLALSATIVWVAAVLFRTKIWPKIKEWTLPQKVIVLIITILFIYYIWPTPWRFHDCVLPWEMADNLPKGVSHSDARTTARTNRITGRVEVLLPDKTWHVRTSGWYEEPNTYDEDPPSPY